jgi:uncharacterized LabA/DUF88 family protein
MKSIALEINVLCLIDTPNLHNYVRHATETVAYLTAGSKAMYKFAYFLEHGLGLTVRLKQPHQIVQSDGCLNITDYAVELTMDMLRYEGTHIVICSNDYRLFPLLELLKGQGKIVTVYGIGIRSNFKNVAMVCEISKDVIMYQGKKDEAPRP